MSWMSATLLLAGVISISKMVSGQCDYVYVAEPPIGELICDPFPINRLQLICSIFVTKDVSLPETLTIQWIFGRPTNGQFDRNNLVLLQEVDFTVTPQETFTSRIVVSSPPVGFYFCLPRLLNSGRQLISSNTATLQPPSFYLQRNIRPCSVNEFQNSSVPVCAVQGVTLGPNQILTPASTIIDTLQFVTPTVVETVTPTAPLIIASSSGPLIFSTHEPRVQETPATSSNVVSLSDVDTRLIAGLVVGSVVFGALILFVGGIILCLVRKNKIDSKYPWIHKSRIAVGERYADNFLSDNLVPPKKPPPTLKEGIRTQSGDHHYSRLNRSTKPENYSSRISGSDMSTYYITPEQMQDDEGVEYYGELDPGHMDEPYIQDESESLIYTDSQYGAESDYYLQLEQQQQEKPHMFVTSSSLELQSDDDGTLPRKVTSARNATNRIISTPYVHQHHSLEHHYDNPRFTPILRKPKNDDSAPPRDTYEEMPGGDLVTGYTNADVLESTSI